MLPYHYSLTSGQFKVNKSVPDISLIKYDVIEQHPGYIHSRATYPDGFIYESKLYPDKLDVWTNRELIKCPDGSYNVSEK